MRGLVRSSRIPGLAGTVCALWLCAAGSAWAGDGGSNLATLSALLNGLCANFNVTSCPKLPTITQAALEIAAQFNVPTEMIRFRDNSGYALIAASPPLVSGQSPLDLSTSTPFASVSSSTANGQASATRLFDENANSFFYAVTSIGPTAQPDTVHVVFEDLFRTMGQVVQGQDVADISLPLVVLNGGAESVVPTKLQFLATCSGSFASCVTTALATGNFSGKGTATYSADQIGLSVASSFGPSLISSVAHATFQVDVPLIVTSATDPLYFFPGVNEFLPAAFLGDETGFIPKKGGILGPKASIGFAPFPAPLCPNNQDCSTKPPQGVFGFCASLPDNNANRLPAVAAFAAIATSGETLISAPVGSSSKITCP